MLLHLLGRWHLVQQEEHQFNLRRIVEMLATRLWCNDHQEELRHGALVESRTRRLVPTTTSMITQPVKVPSSMSLTPVSESHTINSEEAPQLYEGLSMVPTLLLVNQ